MRPIARLVGLSVFALVACVACSSSRDDTEAYPSLTYTRQQYFVGLDETVTIRKDPINVTVVRADGTSESYASLLQDEDAARAARFGHLEPTLASWLTTAQPDTNRLIVAHINVQVDWDLIAQRLQTATTHALALGELTAAIDTSAAPIERQFAALGFTDVHHVSTMPAVFARGSARAIKQLAQSPAVTLVADAEPRVGQNDLFSPSDLIGIHQIDAVLNNHVPGYYGTGQKIGIVQLMQVNAAIFDTHEAFSQNGSIVYQSTALASCNTSNDCNPGCGIYTCKTDNHEIPNTCANESICVNNRCVDAHASEVLSAVSATQSGNPWGAAHAQIFVANNTPSACSPSDLTNAFNWFVTQGVTTVVEPFECGWPPTLNPGVEDYYTRVFSIAVFSSSGDTGAGGTVACPGTFNSVCVGGVDHGMTVASYSNFKNPTDILNDPTDREEPDVVGLGGGAGGSCASYDFVHVIGFNSNTDWGSISAGTSFSVGVMAGMNVVLREACAPFNVFQNELSSRSVMRTAAWDIPVNPVGWRYSTPSVGHDWEYGGGFVTASDAYAFCHPGGPNTTSQVIPIDLNNPSPHPTVSRSYGYTPGSTPPQNAPIHTQDHTVPPGGSDGRDYRVLWSSNFPAGGRVRFTISWDSCSLTPNDWESVPVKPDFDLFLYNTTTHGFLYGSQSTQDNNEGFDVTISASNAGTYTVYAAWPHGTSGCNARMTGINLGWAAAWWTN